MACKYFFVKRCNIINYHYPLTRWQCHQSVQNGRLFYKVWHINIESSDTHVTDLISLPRRKSKKKIQSLENSSKKINNNYMQENTEKQQNTGSAIGEIWHVPPIFRPVSTWVAFCIWECTGFQRDEKRSILMIRYFL